MSDFTLFVVVAFLVGLYAGLCVGWALRKHDERRRRRV